MLLLWEFVVVKILVIPLIKNIYSYAVCASEIITKMCCLIFVCVVSRFRHEVNILKYTDLYYVLSRAQSVRVFNCVYSVYCSVCVCVPMTY